MLIYIDKSVKDALQRNDNTKKIDDIFYDMSVSQRKNRHIIYGDPITISDLEIYYQGKSSDLYDFFRKLDLIVNNWYVYLNTIIRPIFYARVLFDDYTENARYDNHIDINIKKLDKKTIYLKTQQFYCQRILLIRNFIRLYQIIMLRNCHSRKFTIFINFHY